MKLFKYYLIAIGVIMIDQATKLLVYNYMAMGDAGEIPLLGDLVKLHYTLNEGMAFGITFGSEYGKLGLTLFRWIAMFVIGYYIYSLEKKKFHKGFITCIALILGGAVGNVVDSTFYGVFLENAPYAEVTPPLYPWFHGQVIDMIYVDLWQGVIPSWIPGLGGQYMALWPIFNIADSSIFVGVSLIFMFQKKFFPEEFEPKKKDDSTKSDPLNIEKSVQS